jgi:hypothetical protein
VNETLLPSVDKDTQRRRALAKVYSFLLKLAEEAMSSSPGSLDSTTAEQAGENHDDGVTES